jgi:regulator of sirC expression with transglutaminase-like and TPR domain
MPAYCRPSAYALLQQQLPSLETTDGLFRAAFAIALHERPEAQLAEAETVVENLSDTVARRVQSRSTEALLAHLHDVLFEVYGLKGNVDDYYNPANSYLPDLLRTRQGLPISLVLLYKRVAEPLGLTVYGVNAPGHFLAEVAPDKPAAAPLYIDPFFGGGVLNAQEVAERVRQSTGLAPSPTWLHRATHRQWLTRMLNNLQAAFASLGQDRDVCAMQELQSLL